MPVYREDLPVQPWNVRLRTWTCNRCESTACELSTEREGAPVGCPMGLVPDWKEGC